MALLLGDFIAAYFLDLIFGDPTWFPHPIRFIGWIIKKLENRLYRENKKYSDAQLKYRGLLLLIFSVLIVIIPVYIVLIILKENIPFLYHMLNVYLLYSAFATRCLASEAEKIYKSLKNDSKSESRAKIAMLVGRDTDNLSKEEIIKATVETTAENSVDGILSPMFYAFLGIFAGIPAITVYIFKVVSTLDSMVGYKNERYKDFGYFSAKLDDILNYIPARLSLIILPFAALFTGHNPWRTFKTGFRDRKNHLSPNCAYPEGAFAGALGIKLGGTHRYKGKEVYKPGIGDSIKKPDDIYIRKAKNMVYVFSFICFILFIITGRGLIP
jgi:adenosylcobinamide-phosphate synthase